MSNNELIVRLCDLLRQCTDIIEAQSSLLSMHGIETFDGSLEKDRNDTLDAIASITNEIDPSADKKGE